MKRKYVLDAGVLALYFAGRRDAKAYIDAAYTGRADVFMCEVNVAEFLYNYARVFGWEAALTKHALLRNSPITIVSADESLTVKAAELKLRHYEKLSLADCYLLALAGLVKGTVVTTDSRIEDVAEVPVVLLPLE